jgi:hypothetical protein
MLAHLMAVRSPPNPPAEPSVVEAVDAGVIKDARRRQWRLRRIVLFATLAVVGVGIAVYFGVAARAGGAASVGQIAVNVAVTPVITPAADLRVTPSLWPGAVGLCVATVDGTDSGTTCDMPYPGRGVPVIDSPGLPEWLAERPLPLGAEPIYLIAAPNVAKVRIGRTLLKPRAEADLPPGDRMLAVRIPASANPSPAERQPLREIKVTAYDRSGHVLPFASIYLSPVQSSFKIVALHSLATAANSPCALSNALSGYTSHPDLEAERIAGDPLAPQDAFFSCVSSVYVRIPVGRQPISFYAAILLNGHDPGHRPGALWGATHVPGHPGLVENDSPSAIYNSDTFLSGSLIARRAGNAWLVAITQGGHPTLAQRIHFIDALVITRLDIDHA